MMRDYLGSLIFHPLDRVIEEEVDEDSVDTGPARLVQRFLLRVFLRCEFPLVDGEFLRVAVFVTVGLGMLGVCVGGLYLWMAPFDFPLYQLDTPDRCSAELDFPVRAAMHGLQGANMAVQGW